MAWALVVDWVVPAAETWAVVLIVPSMTRWVVFPDGGVASGLLVSDEFSPDGSVPVLPVAASWR
jgi:hypothetical protein